MSRPSLSPSTELLLGGFLIAVSVRWRITPMRHPHAPGWTVAIVVAELAIGLGLAGYAIIRYRALPADRELDIRDRVG